MRECVVNNVRKEWICTDALVNHSIGLAQKGILCYSKDVVTEGQYKDRSPFYHKYNNSM